MPGQADTGAGRRARWAQLMAEDLEGPKPIGEATYSRGVRFELAVGIVAVWVLVTWSGGGRLGLCIGHAAGAPMGEVTSEDRGNGCYDLSFASVLGEHVVHVELPHPPLAVVHWQNTLVPSLPLLMAEGPRPVLALPPVDGGGPSSGVIHAGQSGPDSGLVFASMTQPRSGSLLVVQEFPALRREPAVSAEREAEAAGSWPYIGFRSPANGRGLHAGRSYPVSSGYAAFDANVPSTEAGVAEVFLELYGAVADEMRGQ